MTRTAIACLAAALALGLPAIAGAASDNVASQAPAAFRLIPIVKEGLSQPLFLTHAGDKTGQLYVVEQGGLVKVLDRGSPQPRPFLDVTPFVRSGGEQGLLGLAFHPQYAGNGRVFVSYNRKEDGATVVAEYARGGAVRAESGGRLLLSVPQPYANHNGGMIAFGPDGYLYIGRGDGGSRGDPQNRAQNVNELLGKMLRIDVDRGSPYAIPADNPWAKGGGRPEIFALGLRNPWRFSFDRQTGDLWVADVGQNAWEEIDLVRRGGNYGWRRMEGRHCYEPKSGCEGPDVKLELPVAEYGHEHGRCSVTGGYVYRGPALPSLQGTYLFGDYCSGELFGLPATSAAGGSAEPKTIMRTSLRISSFGEDEAGELYVIDHQGGVYRLAP